MLKMSHWKALEHYPRGAFAHRLQKCVFSLAAELRAHTLILAEESAALFCRWVKFKKKKKKRLQCKLIMKEVSLLSWQSRNEWVSDWRWVICVTQLSWSVCVTLWRKQFIYPQLEARPGLIRVGWGWVGVGVAPMYNHNQFFFFFFCPHCFNHFMQ